MKRTLLKNHISIYTGSVYMIGSILAHTIMEIETFTNTTICKAKLRRKINQEHRIGQYRCYRRNHRELMF